MLHANAAYAFYRCRPKQAQKVIVAFALIACTLLGTGCVGVSQGAIPASENPVRSQTIQTTLPSATVGVSYSQGISINQGQVAHSFLLTEGQLPPGLKVNSSAGVISGVPSEAGSFRFTILDVEEASAAANERTRSSFSTLYSFRIVVASPSSVAVQISP